VDLKRHLFVIVVAVVVAVAVGLYFVFVPSVTSEAETKKKKQCEDKANSIGQLANRAGRPDELKTQKHLDLASKYEKDMQKQISDLQGLWGTRGHLDLRFDKAPKDNTFDIWLGELRKDLITKAETAGLALPQDIEQRMFREPATNDTAKEPSLTRHYRVRHMAIMQEVLNVLITKPVKQELEIWDPKTAGAKKPFELGAISLEKITIHNPRNPSEKSAALDEVNKRSGRTGPAAAAAKVAELPYTITSVDIVFNAPLATVQAYLKALESTTRWTGVVSRVDFKRLASPFPTPGDKRIENAGPVPTLNTYYQEGPVQVLVTVDLYEYDKAREDEFNKVLASLAEAPKPAPAAK